MVSFGGGYEGRGRDWESDCSIEDGVSAHILVGKRVGKVKGRKVRPVGRSVGHCQ